MEFFKSLDVYRKLPGDFVQPTYSGAMLSIISTVLIVLLFLSELSTFLEIKVGSEMAVDVNRGGEKLAINLDITLHRFPCSIVSIDVQDIMGSHTVNVHGTLTKNKLDKNGKIIGQEIYKKAKLDPDQNEDAHGNDEEMPSIKLVQGEIDNEEGCQIFGNFFVNKVPGNFHISAHAYGSIIQKLASMGYFKFDLSHTVNHLTFGDEKELRTIFNEFGETDGNLNPLDGSSKLENQRKVYEYYLKVVPTTYTDLDKNSMYVHQFTASSNELITNMIPTIYFRFDLSPVTVRYWQYKEVLSHFIVQICAIIGGIFAITGIIDGVVHQFVLYLLKGSTDNLE